MNIDSKSLNEQEPAKCTLCNSFYGSEANNGLCSSCFKKTETKKNDIETDPLRKESINTQTDIAPYEQESVQSIELLKSEPQLNNEQEKGLELALKQIDKKRCYNCKKKIGLLGIQCKCGFVYCNTHRLPEEHKCLFNHRKAANDRLKEQLVKVCNGKIVKI